MSGSFLDTTIVVHLAEAIEPERARADTHISANRPASMPYYALQELLAGRVRVLCETHNILRSAENEGEALLAMTRRSPQEGRKKEARMQALANALKDIFSASPTGPREHVKREALQALALKVSRLWRNSAQLASVQLTQSLSCFNSGKLSYGESGELRGPGDSFNCRKNERCAAAAYIYDDKLTLDKLIAALHPNNLTVEAANKNENKMRRKALKELREKGPSAFPKTRCRALGDAYFAAMCPPGSDVLTSNLVDYLPLCQALGKLAREP
ncbi:MAG: hypothetical protein ABIG70_02865 [Pseudomonadota bacterium]